MTKIKNPEAFPLPPNYVRKGMSLRDYFASAAITGLIANPNNSGEADIVAKVAYMVADAMLKFRGDKTND